MTPIDKDRDFMQIAVQEMLESRSEHENKYDPKVGAVIVDKHGQIIEKTHRGSLRVGDHAEFTLIERLLSSHNLEGATLYVTLEPCAIRPSKPPCVERILSARIGRVVIGMIDPDPRIHGHGIRKLLENEVKVEFFNPDLAKQVRDENIDFINQYDEAIDPDAPSGAFEEMPKFEKEVIDTATIDDLSSDRIGEYLRERELAYRVPSREMWDFFQRNGFVARGHRRRQYIPTVAGLLLFGSRPDDFLTQSKIKAEAHSGERVTTEDIGGPLLSQPGAVERFLTKNVRTYTEVQGFKRVEVPLIPWEALREALVNAIVHRDYSIHAHVILQIFDEHIIIRSPGLPPQPTSLQSIRALNALPFSRNPRIAQTFYYMELMEERGWGLRKMHDLLVQKGFPPPVFNFVNGFFEVTLNAPTPKEELVRISEKLFRSLSDRQKDIVHLIQEKGSITSAECAKRFEVSKQAIVTDFNELIEIGIIERRGRGPNTRYVLYGT